MCIHSHAAIARDKDRYITLTQNTYRIKFGDIQKYFNRCILFDEKHIPISCRAHTALWIIS